MKMRKAIFLFLIFFVLIPKTSLAKNKGLPSSVVPDGLGVNIHFVDPAPGEMKMLAESGVRWIRMDFIWETTEKEKGIYDFSPYERLLRALDEYDLRALFILDYGNPLYDQGLAPYTDEGRKAFATWAAAAAKHFVGRGIIWEIWNEPNLNHFWKPEADVNNYIKLALETTRAIKKALPEATIVGPATSHIPLQFLEKIFKAGLLNDWSGVTVHPYRGSFISPETVTPEIIKLRRLIKKYSPEGKEIPILSGEWGYSSASFAMGDKKQGQYLARMWLVNLANRIPLSIWYDWRDDGEDPKYDEHNFGLVERRYLPNQNPVYKPKPAYLAAKSLTSSLKGFQYQKRLSLGGHRDYLLLFNKDEEHRLALWTTSNRHHDVSIPVSPGSFKIINSKGEIRTKVIDKKKRFLIIRLKKSPQYIIPEGKNQRLSELSIRS